MKKLHARKVIRVFDKLLDSLLILLMTGMAAVGGYVLWDRDQVYDTALAPYTQYKPEGANTTSFETLRAANPEVFGWLTVYGTPMDYPLVQADNNEKYLTTTADGGFAPSGAIFLDYRNARDFSDFNSIIFGHHMDKGAMFGAIEQYSDPAFAGAHSQGALYDGSRSIGLEIFAFIKTDAYDKVLYTPALVSQADRQAYLNRIKTQAIWYADTDVSIDDHLVMLSTCSDASTNGRYLLAARLKDTPSPNPYPEVTAPETMDWLKDWLASVKGLPWLLPFGMMLPAVVVKVRRSINKRRRGDS